MESMGSKNGSSSPLCVTPVRERSSPFGDRNVSFINRSVSSDTMKGTISPPPNEEIPSCMVSKQSVTSYNSFQLNISLVFRLIHLCLFHRHQKQRLMLFQTVYRIINCHLHRPNYIIQIYPWIAYRRRPISASYHRLVELNWREVNCR